MYLFHLNTCSLRRKARSNRDYLAIPFSIRSRTLSYTLRPSKVELPITNSHYHFINISEQTNNYTISESIRRWSRRSPAIGARPALFARPSVICSVIPFISLYNPTREPKSWSPIHRLSLTQCSPLGRFIHYRYLFFISIWVPPSGYVVKWMNNFSVYSANCSRDQNGNATHNSHELIFANSEVLERIWKLTKLRCGNQSIRWLISCKLLTEPWGFNHDRRRVPHFAISMFWLHFSMSRLQTSS